MSRDPIVLGITGASGAPYAVRLLDVLAAAKVPLWLIVTGHGWRLLQQECGIADLAALQAAAGKDWSSVTVFRSEEHTSELQSLAYLVCRLLLEKKKKQE